LNRINVDLPPRVLATNLAVATFAALGITSLAGDQARAPIAVPILTLLLTAALFIVPRLPKSGSRRKDEEIRDPLTGVATEAVGQEALAREFAAAQRGRPLTVVLVRLEGIGRYRARHGRTVTNQLLRVAGRTFLRHRRGMHLTARHSGREGTFMSILSATDREGAAIYASRLRRDLMQIKGVPAHGAVSIGIASFDLSMESPRELVRKAAFALERGAAVGGKVMVVGKSA
jgi:diguanylate cyclase (GGDEF)-like protein